MRKKSVNFKILIFLNSDCGELYVFRKKILCGFDLAKTFVETLNTSALKKLEPELKSQHSRVIDLVFLIKLIDFIKGKIKLIHKLLRPGNEERHEFGIGVLKWSRGLFEKVKLDMKQPETIYQSYQKTFGHYEIHQDFAHNLWRGD